MGNTIADVLYDFHVFFHLVLRNTMFRPRNTDGSDSIAVEIVNIRCDTAHAQRIFLVINSIFLFLVAFAFLDNFFYVRQRIRRAFLQRFQGNQPALFFFGQGIQQCLGVSCTVEFFRIAYLQDNAQMLGAVQTVD